MKKTDLVTAVIVFIAGIGIAFATANLLMPQVEDFELKTIDLNTETTLAEPDAEVFNYRAVNPTVEVYVGDVCEVYDDNGNCIEYSILETEPNPEQNNGSTD